MSPPKVINFTKLSEYLGIKKRTLYNMRADGRFDVPPIKGTQPPVWDIDAVNSWLGKK